MKQKPPKTLRFCESCNEIRDFEYVPIIGHSSCMVCGSRISRYITREDLDKHISKLYIKTKYKKQIKFDERYGDKK